MEVEVAAENFVSTLTGKDHLNSHGLDLPCHKVHRCGGSNRRYVIRFKLINDLLDGVKPLLNRVRIRVVNGAKEVSDSLRSLEVGGVGETDGEGVESGKGTGLAGNVAGADGGDEGGVKAAAGVERGGGEGRGGEGGSEGGMERVGGSGVRNRKE